MRNTALTTSDPVRLDGNPKNERNLQSAVGCRFLHQNIGVFFVIDLMFDRNIVDGSEPSQFAQAAENALPLGKVKQGVEREFT